MQRLNNRHFILLLSIISVLSITGCSTISSVRPINSLREILHLRLESCGDLGSKEFEKTLDVFTNSKSIAGNELILLQNGNNFFPKLMEEIDKAQEYINIAMYDYTVDEIGSQVTAKLIDALSRGVKVRLTYDEFGCDTKIEDFTDLIAAGGEVLTFNSIKQWTFLRMNSRNHRKIVDIDGVTAFISGLNISDNYNGNGFDGWRDSGVMIKGPVCNEIEKIFAQCWNQAGADWFGKNLPLVGMNYLKRIIDYPFIRLFNTEYVPVAKQIPPCGNVNIRIVEQSPEWIDSYHINLFTIAINAAKKSVYISTPYFLPPDLMRRALIDAADRGVDVRILTQGKTDLELFKTISNGEFHVYKKHGARIWGWYNSILHNKCAIIDGKYLIGGSVNLDCRSLLMNYEIAYCTNTREKVEQFTEVFLNDLKLAKEYTYEETREMINDNNFLFAPLRGQM